MRALRLKDLGHWYSGGTPPRDRPEHWDGDVPWLSAKDIDSTRLRLATTFITHEAALKHSRMVPAGAVLVIVRGMALAHGLPVVETSTRVAFNQDLRALVCVPDIETRFVYYSLIGHRWRLNAHVDQAAHGTARVNDTIYSERIEVPDRGEQQAITVFLDRECARIDMVAQELVGLDDSLRQALSSRVSRMLAANDAHASRRKLSWEMTLLIGFAFPSSSFVHDPEVGTRLLRGINLSPDGTRWEEVVYWPLELHSEVERFELSVGDLVVGLNRPWIRNRLRCGMIEPADLPALLLQRVGCLRPRADSQLHPRFAKLWLETDTFRQAVRDDAAVTFPMLEPSRMMAFRLPVPSIDVQLKIIEDAQDARRRCDAARAELAELGHRLQSYRDALIAEAVSGQLDVTRLSARQMEESLTAVCERERPEVLAR